MIIRGIDPGSPCHYADIALGGLGATFVRKGSWTHEEALKRRPYADMVVAIERPFGLYLELSGPELFGVTKGVLMAAWIGGKIAGALARDGVRVIEVPCPDARRHFGVKIGGSVKKGTSRVTADRQIANMIQARILGWPGRSCKGSRDAAVTAYYAAHLISCERAEDLVDAKAKREAEERVRHHVASPGAYGPGDCGRSDYP